MAEKRYTLRMDEDLFNQIAELASLNRRSTAKEIEFAIEQYVRENITTIRTINDIQEDYKSGKITLEECDKRIAVTIKKQLQKEKDELSLFLPDK